MVLAARQGASLQALVRQLLGLVDTCDVHTYPVRMNLTLSVDDKLVEKARQVAARQGTSLQALVRQFLERLAGSREGAALVEQLERHWREADKHLREHPPKSYKFDREELYEARVGRRQRGE
jgi:antitoxin component of RelBE/YafQ-DinJ toxin-antitoxin module